MLEHTRVEPAAPSRAVVMGAGGFVGGAIVQRLAARDIPVLALGRADIDLLAPEAGRRLAALLQPGDAFVAASARAPVKNGDMLVQNMVMARAMASALEQSPVAHVLNIGSDAVYADASGLLSESSPMAPSSLHGAMHLARELVFQEAVKSPLATLRPTLIYGAADPHNGYGPNRFRRMALAGQPIELFGEGEEQRDHVHVDDVAELAVRILLHASRGALNAATGEVHSFRDVALAVVRDAGSGSTVTGTPRRGPMPHNGWRAFDARATHEAFPDFRYTPLTTGLALSRLANPPVRTPS